MAAGFPSSPARTHRPRPSRRTLAQVDLNVTLTGFAALPPKLPQAEPGVVRTRVRWIVVKRAGDWQILSQQMTALPPGAQF